MTRDWLFTGTVHHARQGVAANAFRYPCLMLCFPLARRQELQGRLFGVNRCGLFSFYDADHGDGGDPERWIRTVLHNRGIHQANGEIWLLTMPRVLGYVFNPVSFWFCHDASGALRAVLCEVNNTFGERHSYLVSPPDAGVITPETSLRCDKVFHVSPFLPASGEYRFHFSRQERRVMVRIDYFRQRQLLLAAGLTVRANPLSDAMLLRALLRMGWATVMTVLRIHWQALRLWLKGAPFHSKPVPPREEISS